MFKISRRTALLGLLASTTALTGIGYLGATRAPEVDRFSSAGEGALPPFEHGVASGDPKQDRVVIWSRISPDAVTTDAAEVTWEMASDLEFSSDLKSGVFTTDAGRDWTIKVDVEGLQPGRIYYYRFGHNGKTSNIGKTRTLPVGGVETARFAVVSCANWQYGYFNAYDHIAKSGDFDAVLHLGDYIYEYGQTEARTNPPEGAVRLHQPAHELITLDDFRTRLAQARTDASLQAMTAAMPMIAIWDDHEVANDSYRNGAENHQNEEGPWVTRRDAALQAYYEWLPVREPAPGRSRLERYDSFEWGDLATIVTVESRLLARDKAIVIEDHYELLDSEGGPEKFRTEILNDPDRKMLGSKQLDFVTEQFAASKAADKPWRILANQVVMANVLTPDLNPHVSPEAIDSIRPKWSGIDDFVRLSGYRLPYDAVSWTGYPAARQALYDRLEEVGVNDIMVLAGDSHEFWANDLKSGNGKKHGVEIGATSVTSFQLKEVLGSSTDSYALLVTQENPDVRYYNAMENGYVELTLTKDEASVRMIALDTIREQNYGAYQTASFKVRRDGDTLRFARPSGLDIKQYALYRGWA